MKKEYQDVISEALGVKPVLIDSALVSAQNRKRLYWTNIPFLGQPDDKGIFLKDILEDGYDLLLRWVNSTQGAVFEQVKSATLRAKRPSGGIRNMQLALKNNEPALLEFLKLYLSEQEQERAVVKHSAQTWRTGNKMGAVRFPTDENGKSKCLIKTYIRGDRALNHIRDLFGVRCLSPTEYESLQTVPKNYTIAASTPQRYIMLGNGWNVDTIVHLFQGLKCNWF